MSDKDRIKELEREVEILKALVIFDPLTGLYTRQGLLGEVSPIFDEVLFAHTHPGERRTGAADALSLLFIDLDDFKKINDSQGHAAGDKVLTRVAELIQTTVRSSDVVGRWGGEEILVSLPGVSEKVAGDIAEKVRATIERDGGTTVSVGVAELTKSDAALEDLIGRADKAMYEAKQTGKNRVVRHSELAYSE